MEIKKKENTRYCTPFHRMSSKRRITKSSEIISMW